MKKLVNKNFENELYTLVYEFNDIPEEESIYYFYNGISNKHIFCTKENEEYIQIISNEKINQIKEQKNLLEPDILFSFKKLIASIKNMTNIREMNEQEKIDFYEEQYQKLKSLGIKGIDYPAIRQKIFSPGAVYIADNIQDASGICDIISKDIYLKKDADERIKLHETIHKITAMQITGILTNFLATGFIEGATEKLAQRIIPPQSSIKVYKDSKNPEEKNKRIVFNQGGGYQENVSLIKQIEIATGMTVDKDILEGKVTILKEFGKKYGYDLLNEVINTTNVAIREYGPMGDAQLPDIALFNKFTETQNILLERVFDKEYPKDITPENARQYLEKMKQMELVRGRADGDTFFKTYYTKQYESLKSELLSKGYPEEEISKSIQEYQPRKFEKATIEISNQYFPSSIAEILKEREITEVKPEDIKKFTAKKDGQEYSILFIKGELVIYEENSIEIGNNLEQKIERPSTFITSYEIEGEKIEEIKKIELTPEGKLKILDKDGKEIIEAEETPLFEDKEMSEESKAALLSLADILEEPPEEVIKRLENQAPEKLRFFAEDITRALTKTNDISEIQELAETQNTQSVKSTKNKLKEKIGSWLRETKDKSKKESRNNNDNSR